jgi:hypothetical protein
MQGKNKEEANNVSAHLRSSPIRIIQVYKYIHILAAGRQPGVQHAATYIAKPGPRTVTELGFWHRVCHTKILISNLAKTYLAIRYTAAKFAS